MNRFISSISSSGLFGPRGISVQCVTSPSHCSIGIVGVLHLPSVIHAAPVSPHAQCASTGLPVFGRRLLASTHPPNKSLEDNGGRAGSWVVGSVFMHWGFRAVPQLWR